jgi:hypothetical protein
VTSQVTTAPGRGSRGQTSSDGPIASVSANPTPRDLAGRSPYPGNGDAQRPNPAVPSDYRSDAVESSLITAGQRRTVSGHAALRLPSAGAR